MKPSESKEQFDQVVGKLASNQPLEDGLSRQKLYSELLDILKQNNEEKSVMHHVGQNLWKCLQIVITDITNCEQTNPCLHKAFTILGFLAHHSSICPMFSPTQVKQFFSLIFNKVNSDKRSCALGVWCLGSQQFSLDHLVPFMRQIFECLNMGIKNPFHSHTAVIETLKSLSYLLNRIKDEDALKYSEYWLVDLIKVAVMVPDSQ